MYFSPKCEGVFIMSSWVTASGHVDGWCVFTVSIFRAKPWRQTQWNLTEWHPCALCAETERHLEFRRECRWELLLEGRQRPRSPQKVSSGHVPGGPVAETVPLCRGPVLALVRELNPACGN